jgi:hypothetical protein
MKHQWWFAIISAALLGCSKAEARQPAPTTGHVGRYQIANGTGEWARNIMLLDTETGDSWRLCQAATPRDTTSAWCPMEIYVKAKK